MKPQITTTDNERFTITCNKVVKNSFGNKRIVPIVEIVTLEALNKKITQLKKQLTELTNKKKLIKQHIKGVTPQGESSPKGKEV